MPPEHPVHPEAHRPEAGPGLHEDLGGTGRDGVPDDDIGELDDRRGDGVVLGDGLGPEPVHHTDELVASLQGRRRLLRRLRRKAAVDGDLDGAGRSHREDHVAPGAESQRALRFDVRRVARGHHEVAIGLEQRKDMKSAGRGLGHQQGGIRARRVDVGRPKVEVVRDEPGKAVIREAVRLRHRGPHVQGARPRSDPRSLEALEPGPLGDPHEPMHLLVRSILRAPGPRFVGSVPHPPIANRCLPLFSSYMARSASASRSSRRTRTSPSCLDMPMLTVSR